MNHQRSPVTRVDDDGASSSPKRKKVRSKYAPKACVSCRRSKLKCSGENPCQRCVDNGRRCFYSEDQTAAEALQNLSRPTAVQPPRTAHGMNGNGPAPRNILPRHESTERRASDASVLGMSMEARMARIEGMMESLVQERSVIVTPRGSMERDEAISDSLFLSEVAIQPASISVMSPANRADSPATIRVGSSNFPFPHPTEYQKHLDFLFNDLSSYYPCINEADFRMRSEHMLAAQAIHSSDVCFLGLHYMVFACSDIAVDAFPVAVNSKPPGWQWFQAANDLVGQRELSGRGDLSLIQYLVLKAAYLISADMPNAAYNAIGLGCRLGFQFGLHQQSSWRNHTPFEIHMRQRIFWTAYVLDRKISLSCGRPYCIREPGIDIEQPTYLSDRDIHPDQPLPEPDPSRSSNMFLNSMACWGRLSADVWDGLFDAAVIKNGINSENALILDAQIKHWTEIILPTIPLLPLDQPPELVRLRQHILIHTRLSLLRLYIFRQFMVSLKYDGERGRVCGDLAVEIVQRIRDYSAETSPLNSFRFHMITSLNAPLLVLSTLCLRDLASIGLQDSWKLYADGFGEALEMIRNFSQHTNIARRILTDFREIIPVVIKVLDQQQDGQSFPQHLVPVNIRDLFPYSSLDFAQQSGGNTFNVDTDPTQASDTWDFELFEREGKYGVPWI